MLCVALQPSQHLLLSDTLTLPLTLPLLSLTLPLPSPVTLTLPLPPVNPGKVRRRLVVGAERGHERGRHCAGQLLPRHRGQPPPQRTLHQRPRLLIKYSLYICLFILLVFSPLAHIFFYLQYIHTYQGGLQRSF